MQMLMEVAEREMMEVVEREMMEVVEREIARIELVIVQIEFAQLLGIVPQWGSSGHSPLPAM